VLLAKILPRMEKSTGKHKQICLTGYQIKLECKDMHKLSLEISLKIKLMHIISRDNIMFNLQRLYYSCA